MQQIAYSGIGGTGTFGQLVYRGPLFCKDLTNDDRLVLVEDDKIIHLFVVVMVDPSLVIIRDTADDRMIWFEWDDFHQYAFIKLEGVQDA